MWAAALALTCPKTVRVQQHLLQETNKIIYMMGTTFLSSLEAEFRSNEIASFKLFQRSVPKPLYIFIYIYICVYIYIYKNEKSAVIVTVPYNIRVCL